MLRLVSAATSSYTGARSARSATCLLRLEGQARGIRQMLDEQRDCDEILVQLAALKQATSGVAVALFQAHVER